jgi:hypothetical protein
MPKHYDGHRRRFVQTKESAGAIANASGIIGFGQDNLF